MGKLFYIYTEGVSDKIQEIAIKTKEIIEEKYDAEIKILNFDTLNDAIVTAEKDRSRLSIFFTLYEYTGANLRVKNSGRGEVIVSTKNHITASFAQTIARDENGNHQYTMEFVDQIHTKSDSIDNMIYIVLNGTTPNQFTSEDVIHDLVRTLEKEYTLTKKDPKSSISIVDLSKHQYHYSVIYVSGEIISFDDYNSARTCASAHAGARLVDNTTNQVIYRTRGLGQINATKTFNYSYTAKHTIPKNRLNDIANMNLH